MSESFDRFHKVYQRLLQMVEELHRQDFEELRFSRGRATQHIRL